MIGLVFAVACAYLLGSLFSYLVGAHRIGSVGHLFVGLIGLALSWLFVMFLPIPHLARIAVNGVAVYPVWLAVGALLTALVVGILIPEDHSHEVF